MEANLAIETSKCDLKLSIFLFHVLASTSSGVYIYQQKSFLGGLVGPIN